MKNKIIENVNNPEVLENLYREDNRSFRDALLTIPDEANSDLLRFWKIRLAAEKEQFGGEFLKKNLFAVVLLSLIGIFLAQLPQLFPQIDQDLFYARNLPIILFNGIILYTFWQSRLFKAGQILLYGSVLILLTLFVNLLPGMKSDAVTLALLHSPLFLWCLFGLSFIAFDYKSSEKRIEFIRFNGEFLIMTGLILIAGGVLAGITIALFSAIKMNIEDAYMEYIAVSGVVAAPMLSYYLIRLYPNLTNRIAPVIARVFTPLVLITLVVYLISLIFSESNILTDRDLLLVFNIMLLAVLAIIVFSLTELDKSKDKNVNVLMLMLLALIAIVINSIALVAIVSRVADGLTPNRVAVLVSNLLIFVNLILIATNLYKSYFNRRSLVSVENTVARYLTVYAAWTVVVVFIFPFIFE